MKGKIEQKKAVMTMALIVIVLTAAICTVAGSEYGGMQMAIGETEVSGIALASGTELENGDVLETLQQLNDEISRYKFYSECLLGVSCVCILIAIFAVALLIKELVYLKKKGKATEDKSGALEKCEIANDKVAHPENDGDANTPTENDGGANKLTGEEGCAANAEDGEKSSEIITGQSILEEWQKLKDCHSELTERYDELIKNFVDKVKDPENSADAKSGDMISVSREEWIKRNEADIKLGKSIRDASENLVNILTEVKLYDKEDVVPIKNYVIQCINKILVNIIKGMVEYRPREGAKFNVYTMKDVTEATGEKLGIIKEVITPGRCVGNYVVEPAEVIRYIETEDKEMGDDCLEKEEDVLGNTSGSRSSISHDVSTGSKLCGRKEQHKKQPKQALGKETIAKSSGINTPGQEKDKKN